MVVTDGGSKINMEMYCIYKIKSRLELDLQSGKDKNKKQQAEQKALASKCMRLGE